MTNRHKVFVSFHHANDQGYRERFDRLGVQHDIMVPWSVQDGDIDPRLPADTVRGKIRDGFLRDATVTVVLVGTETWKRKHVDWEIGSTIRNTTYNRRAGLLGILLPSYLQANGSVNKYTIPPRLADNVDKGYAKLYHWTENPRDIQNWIHEAFERREQIIPDNSRDGFAVNRTGDRWW